MAIELIIGALDLSKYVRQIDVDDNDKSLRRLWGETCIVYFKKQVRAKNWFWEAITLIANKPQSVYINVKGEIKTYPRARARIVGRTIEISKTAMGGFVMPDNYGLQNEIRDMGQRLAGDLAVPAALLRDQRIVWEAPRVRPRENPDPPYMRGEYVAGIDFGEQGLDFTWVNVPPEFRIIPQRLDLTALDQEADHEGD